MASFATLLCVMLGLGARSAPPNVSVGEIALAFTLRAVNEPVAMELVNSSEVGLSDFVGLYPQRRVRALVLHFFARDESSEDAMSRLNRLQRRYQNKGVQVLAISMNNTGVETLSKWVTEQRVVFPVLVDNHGVVSSRYGIGLAQPTTLIIDERGYIFAIGRPSGDLFSASISAELDGLL